jgi:hypothetical protein
MKYLLLVLFLFSSSVASDSFAQKSKAKAPAASNLNGVKRLDTLTIGGIRPGDQLAAFRRADFKLDTVFWTGNMGANMVKGIHTQFGQKGECRITTRDGEVQQVAFNMTFADSVKTMQAFKRLEKEFSTAFGDPDDEYHNVHYMIKWMGDKRILQIKTMDGTNTLSVTLTPVAKPAANPKLPTTK